ncbi:MAG: calcium/sodium antiporter, partial [Anaerolineae bacterium]
MWVPLLVLILGLVALVWSADRFLAGAASTAGHFGVPKILIGLTVVSLGTSAPEILVALAAAMDGNALLAVGNAVGSNIANIGLVLGITAMIAPLPFSRGVLRKELPWLLGATFLALWLLFDLQLTRLDGLALLAGMAFILYRLVKTQHATTEGVTASLEEEIEELQGLTR